MQIKITAEIPDRWVPAFLGFLNQIQYCGNIGRSQLISIYADGDGDFNPKFIFESNGKLPKPARPIQKNGKYIYDAG